MEADGTKARAEAREITAQVLGGLRYCMRERDLPWEFETAGLVSILCCF